MLIIPLAMFHLFELVAALPLTNYSQTNISNDTLKPECQDHCGEVHIPYPFGITDDCAISKDFTVVCDGKQPYITLHSLQNISAYGINVSDWTLITSNDAATICYDESGPTDSSHSSVPFDLSDTPFTFSERNKLFLIGCDDTADIFLSNEVDGKYAIYSYNSTCTNQEAGYESRSGSCWNNVGCQQGSINGSMTYYNIRIRSDHNHSGVLDSNPCGFAFLGDEEGFRFRGLADLNDSDFAEDARSFPVVLDWVIGDLPCAEAVKNTREYACRENSECRNSSAGRGYTCSCKQGYRGNPFLPHGCKDIDECNEGPNPCHHNAYCENFPDGDYTCTCRSGYSGEGRISDGGCINNSQSRITRVALGVGLGVLFMLIGISWMYFFFKRRKLVRMREAFFKKNGGILLENRMSSGDNAAELTRVFTIKELERATDRFSEDQIIGQGGYGTVFKGILPDTRVVAIKKAIITDPSQIEPFINEVVILTQVNHRNIVKLYGCCLETEVPLLVYEFIPNGTLYFHIHNSGMDWLSWNNRLRIVAEAAGALAYLHSSASMPIIHRDVKSPNILIDENYNAKISDFGASRLVPFDRTQVTTLVQGTLGYLDPEYFHTSQLTEKSDVYSFGVVLAEILTGQRPICLERNMDERSLSSYFLMAMKENRLFRILDPRVIREGTLDQLQAISELTKKCLNLYSEDRPSMKVVAAELENLRKFNTQHWVCPHDHHETGGSGSGIKEQESDLYTNTMSDVSGIDTAPYLLYGLNTPR